MASPTMKNAAFALKTGLSWQKGDISGNRLGRDMGYYVKIRSII